MNEARILIVTPTYNEADNIQEFVTRVLTALPQANILVVDDNSPDGTGRLVDEMCSSETRLFVLHRKKKSGLGSAYIDGFRWGRQHEYEVFFEMDADLSHDPNHLPQFMEHLRKGADVVIGSRNIKGGRIEGWGPIRHLISKGGSWYSRIVLGLSIRDLTSGFKAFTAKAIELIDFDTLVSEGYSFQIEANYRAVRHDLQIIETPIVFVDRRAGQSKMSWKIFLEAVFVVWKIALRHRRWEKK